MDMSEEVYIKKHIDKEVSSRAKQKGKDAMTELKVYGGRYLA